MTTKAMQEQIIDKHMAALLLDLKRHGIDALGVAGGVVLATPAGASACDVFFLVVGDIGLADGAPFDSGDFVRDVAKAMSGSSEHEPPARALLKFFGRGGTS
jgi:hypothetical protein